MGSNIKKANCGNMILNTRLVHPTNFLFKTKHTKSQSGVKLVVRLIYCINQPELSCYISGLP